MVERRGCGKAYVRGNWGKMARKWFFRKMGKNNVKRNKKTRKNSNFSVKMSQTIFHPTHPVRKK